MKMSKGTSGSSVHRGESIGPGPVAGAGETMPRGPGKMGRGIASDMYPSAKTGKGPSKVPNRTRGQEEDGD